MRVLIASGGTGGHIYPGIAVAEEIARRGAGEGAKKARGYDGAHLPSNLPSHLSSAGPSDVILFVGSEDGLEKELVAEAGFQIKLIKARALLRKLSYKALSAPFVSLIGFFQALSLNRSFRPEIVVATGGYASLPVVLAARLFRVPIVLLEQNVLPGAVSRFTARFAAKVFLSWPESERYLRGEVSGNPVRRRIIEADRAAARRRFGYGEEKVVLIMGGSQGAKKLNETVLAALDRLPSGIKILHLVGNRDAGWVNNYLAGKQVTNYQALPYLHDMSDALAAADLVISRAGATAIAEFLVRGLPMVLIPFPYAAEDHQRLNAEAVAQSGAAVVVADRELTEQKLLELLTDATLEHDKMGRAAAGMARPRAAERIVDHLYERA